MMDGRIGAIRAALDSEGFTDVSIMVIIIIIIIKIIIHHHHYNYSS